MKTSASPGASTHARSDRKFVLHAKCPGLYAYTNYPGYGLGLYFRIQDRRVKPSLAWDSDAIVLGQLDLRSPTTVGRKPRKSNARGTTAVQGALDRRSGDDSASQCTTFRQGHREVTTIFTSPGSNTSISRE